MVGGLPIGRWLQWAVRSLERSLLRLMVGSGGYRLTIPSWVRGTFKSPKFWGNG
jgi:hypothetical protein